MFYSMLSFLFYSAPILTLVMRSHHDPNVIAPRYIIEGQPPLPCKNDICPLAKPISTSTNTSEDTPTLLANNSNVDKTTLANSTLPRPHQTAPVKCGDTNLPPPCNVTSGSNAANTKSVYLSNET
ncbi:hypothetical protein CROQUDRAFT_661800 [Cronartium quercuum f. sp. fusiforme G11]|uniref:Uncharacterized protein n=1 Tax=Cronartium quercuum f. sp. fusiforme G11 TaxID=708437 RepID=A0A9P6T8G1_9BASI|nr:hypothetical protein CROQUDRAFT_661800 [Cronartium quercuum f. sp. fusiforme G11]